MTNQTLQPPAESRLRRWWRYFYAAMEAAATSGYEHSADRIDYLEKRVRRLEALHAPPQDNHD